MSNSDQFLFGLNYWPRSSGFGWWHAYDAGEVREDFNRIAGFGCNTLRLSLYWEDFQPAPRKVGSQALRSFERALDTAYAARLKVAAVLFPVALAGTLHVPRWASRVDPLEQLQRPQRTTPAGRQHPASSNGAAHPPQHNVPEESPVVYEGGYHRSHARDLFTDPAMREAQEYLMREIVGYFGQHPALAAWQLGEGLEWSQPPASATAATAWYRELAELVRQLPGSVPVLGVASSAGLLQPNGPQPAHIAAACDIAGIALDVLPPLKARPGDTALPVFVHALATALAGAPLLVTGLGLPTAGDLDPQVIADTVFGRAARSYLAHPQQQAEFIANSLEQLRAAGARGVLLPAYADYPHELWRQPPFDRVIAARTLGVVDAVGQEKPVVAALRAFAATLADSASVAASALDVDLERYWRSPQRACERLWRQWNA